MNIVEEGADDTGERSVNDVLQRVHGDGTEVYLPAGTYLLNPIQLGGSNWSLVGDGPGKTIIKVPNWVHGSNHNYLTVSGHNWEVRGVTIDLSAPDAAPVNLLRGTDWAFRNVHMKGQMSDPQTRQGANLFYPAVTSSGSTGLMEDVVMKDGTADPDDSSNRGGMWFGSNNRGHMILRGLHMEKFANNTVYAAASAGPVTIEDCLFKNTNVGVRIGGNTTVRNCVWIQDGRVPAQRWTGGRAGRGLWINSNSYDPGDIQIENCHFTMTGVSATDAIWARYGADGIDMRNCRIEQGNGRMGIHVASGASSPAFEGVSITGDSSAPAVRLVDCDGASFRDVCVQQPGTGIELNSSANSHVDSSTINTGGQALVLNSSDLETKNFTQSGSCPVPSRSPDENTGTSDDPIDSGSSDDSSSSELTELISITTRESDLPINYRLTVTGDMEKDDPGLSTINPEDEISDSTAIGVVDVGDSDSYAYSGEIDELVLDHDTVVWYNGQMLDSSAYTVDESAFNSNSSPDEGLANELVVEGDTTRRLAWYAFTVSGELEKDEIDGTSINDADSIDGQRAEGFVVSGSDGYRFSGELSSLTLDGDATVYLNGEEIDPSSYDPDDQFPNTIVINGRDIPDRSEYAFEVSGELRKSPSLGSVTAEDVIEDGTVSGLVRGGVDGYRFSGRITRFRLEGSADVVFEDVNN